MHCYEDVHAGRATEQHYCIQQWRRQWYVTGRQGPLKWLCLTTTALHHHMKACALGTPTIPFPIPHKKIYE